MKHRHNCRRPEAEGKRRRGDACALLEARRQVYIRRGRRLLLRDLLEGETATADDLYDLLDLPPQIDVRCLGAIPGPLVRAGIVRSLGLVKSVRPERHGARIRLWVLADRAAAERWLAEHPDRADPEQDAGRSESFVSPISTPNELTPTVAAAGAGMED